MRRAIMFLTAIGLAGCKHEALPTTEDAPRTSVTDTTDESAIRPSAQPSDSSTGQPAKPAPAVIKLLEPGKKPRRALRWSRALGLEERLTMRVDTEVDALIGVLNAKPAPRSVTLELTVRTNEALPEGTAAFSFTVDEIHAHHAASVPPKARKNRDEAVATMRGLQGSYRIDDLGAIQEVVIDLPADASRELWSLSEDLEWALRQLAAPFPEEPIGAGARWTIDRAVEQSGVNANEVSTLKITKLKKQLITLKTEVRQSATPQTFRNPGSSMLVQLTEYNAEAAGKMTWDPTRLVPRSAEMSFTETKHVRYKVKRQPTTMIAVTRRKLTIPSPGGRARP